ncbi:MAG: FCD domain-containing protein [Pseudomonadota bacterium]
MLWGLKPVEQKAAHGLAVDRLKRSIHLGLVLPGERLASERRLAEQIGISRVTLREALSVLEMEGYVTIRRGAAGGAFVADETALLTMAENQFSAQAPAALRAVEYRESAEPVAARLAAVRRTPADLKHIQLAIVGLTEARSRGEIRRGEATFHLCVAQASGNRFFASSIEEAMASMFLPFPSDDAAREMAESLQRCRAVADAIRLRQEALAEAAMADLLAIDRRRMPTRRVA